MNLILSCEHGGNEIPQAYSRLFKGHEKVLNSHRGYDPGTLDLFHYLKSLAVFSRSNTISRLLIEYNRSMHHPQLFSEFSAGLNAEDKKLLFDTYYIPYRSEIESAIRQFIGGDQKVLHISLHSFTPDFNGERRNNDIGLLYDSSRLPEKEFSAQFKSRLLEEDPGLHIRANYPYLGKADGFTTYLRKCFQKNYLGIELELNQALLQKDMFPILLKQQLKRTIASFIL